MRNDRPAPIGVYLHIPFCRKKCDYCDFCSTAQWDEALLDAYLIAIKEQIGAFFAREGRLPADTVYIGGGTPSVFGGERISALLAFLRERAELLPGAEITVEVNPESADEALFRTLKRAGVNRVSMGVQSAVDGELEQLGRIHSFAQAREAAALCRAHCTDNLSLDLMFGLPLQDRESWLFSVDALCDLAPRHLSCYALKLEEGTPMFQADPPRGDDDLQADMYLAMVERLQERGYEQYEISNFAQKGYRSRHNQKYWDLSEYIGFGCAAHSFYHGKRFYQTADLQAFLRGGWCAPLLEDEVGSPAGSREAEYLMLALRTVAGVEKEDYRARFGRDFAPIARALTPYLAGGFVQRTGDRWHFTPKGFLVSNTILVAVLEAMENREGGRG